MKHRIYKWQRGDRCRTDHRHLTEFADIEETYDGSWAFRLATYRWLRRGGLGPHHARLAWWLIHIEAPEPHVIGHRLAVAS